MCGFIGFTGILNSKETVLQRMMDRIVHRGPDMGGQQPGGNAGSDGQQYYDADYEVVDDDKK